MRFSVQLPSDRIETGGEHSNGEFSSGGAIAEMALAAEAAGFDAAYVTEHPFPADAWLASGGHHALDPFVSLASAAAATRRLRLHTNILVLPYRNPFLTAKAVASLDVVSSGRVILGVAAGYLTGEAIALGSDDTTRNERCDDALAAMREAWSGRSVTRVGPGYEAGGNTMLPRPVQRPHPPIWIGGNSDRAIRRAVEHGQGWSPFPVPHAFAGRARTSAIENVEDLRVKIERLHSCAAAAGRDDRISVNFVPFGYGMNTQSDLDAASLIDQIGALAEVGVDWLSVGLHFTSRSQYLEGLDRFAREVIAETRAP